LRAYAGLEVLVAVVALLLPFALAASATPLAAAYADGSAPLPFAAARIVISLFLLGVPAAAMGATFPIAASWFAEQRPRRHADAAADTGLLYAANTAGAALGAIAAGFWLIPSLGLRGTTWVGVALNVVAASGAWWIARGVENAEGLTAANAENTKVVAHKRKKDPSRSPLSTLSPPSPGLACTAAAISGLAALVY